MEFQTGGSRRQFLSTVAKTADAAILLRPSLGWAVAAPRVAGVVVNYDANRNLLTTGCFTHTATFRSGPRAKSDRISFADPNQVRAVFR